MVHHHHHVLHSSAILFSTDLKGVSHAKDLLARDKARAQKLQAGVTPHGPLSTEEFRRLASKFSPEDATSPAANPDSVDVTDAAVTYTAVVNIGNPSTAYSLLIDTGSSNTWVGAGKKYKPTSTSKDTGKKVNVSYGSGSFSGEEYTDLVSLNNHLTVQKQSIGVAKTTQGMNGVDGILGVGPTALTMGSLGTNETIPTITDNLYKQKTITTELLAVSYVPTTSTTSLPNGEMTFGDVDSSKYTGEIAYVPITSKSPANAYWGIDQSVTYGDTQILTNSAGIVDTGTTLLLLATPAFQAYQKATGATLDSSTGLLTVTEEQFANMQSMFFTVGDTTFEFTPNAQIWPRSLVSLLGGTEGKIYLITADLGSDLGSLDFINGFCFLQRFYSVYDTTNKRVGLATTQYTDATTN